MLAQKQSKCKYLSDAFNETPCGQFFIFIVILISFAFILYLWFKVNTLWFETKNIIIPIMGVQFTIVFTCISTIIGILFVYETKTKDPTVSLCKAFQDNIEYFWSFLFIIGALLIAVFIRCVYVTNIWIIEQGYIFSCLPVTNSTNSIKQRAYDCTFFELFVIPISLIVIFVMCILICLPLIEALTETLDSLNKKSKIYDASQNLLHEKENV